MGVKIVIENAAFYFRLISDLKKLKEALISDKPNIQDLCWELKDKYHQQ